MQCDHHTCVHGSEYIPDCLGSMAPGLMALFTLHSPFAFTARCCRIQDVPCAHLPTGYGLKRVAHKYVVSFFHAASVRRAAPTNASRMRAVAKQLAATIMPGSVPGTLTSHLTASPHRANASAQHISTQQPSTAGPSKGKCCWSTGLLQN